MKLEGRWSVRTAGQERYQLDFRPDGEAWAVRLEGNGRTPSMSGVGFEHNGFLCVSRGIVTQAAELGGSVGLVQYDVTTFGNLPARWYHPSLNGQLSEGLSANGPSDTLVGEYDADYQNAQGDAFNPLRKTITKSEDRHLFSWWDETRFHYLGVGRLLAGALFAAWGAPGAILQFAAYDLRSGSDQVEGAWLDYGRNRAGTEVLTPDKP